MRKLYALLAAGALLVAMAVPAYAASGSDTATMTVNVPVSISINFTDDTEAFGQVLTGETQIHLGALAYDVSTNNAAGFKVDITAASYNSVNAEELFFIGKGCDVSWVCTGQNQINDTGPQANLWRTEAAGGNYSYLDDVKVFIPGGHPAGSYSATVTYVATTL